MCCLLWRIYKMHPALSLKTGCDIAASNDVAEYEALVNALRITIELGVKLLDVRGNSQLVIY
jgi:ribonuclease HI